MPFEIVVGDIEKQIVDVIGVGLYALPRNYKHPDVKLCEAGKEIDTYGEYLDSKAEIYSNNCSYVKWIKHRAKAVITVVTEFWRDDTMTNRLKFKENYLRLLNKAEEYGAKSFAIELMYTGRANCPLGVAGRFAVQIITEWLSEKMSDMQVILVVDSYDAKLFYELADQTQNILNPINKKEYENETKRKPAGRAESNYYSEYAKRLREDMKASGTTEDNFNRGEVERILKKYLTNGEELSRIIEYDKGLINKFKNGKSLKPHRHRVIAMAIGMDLPDEERYRFINCVGYKYPELNDPDLPDSIIEEKIRDGVRDFISINTAIKAVNPEFSLKKGSKRKKTEEKIKDK